MFGEVVKRYCNNCEKEVSEITTVGVEINGETLYPGIRCPYCNANLSERDEELIAKAKEDGRSFGVVMF